MCVSLQKKDREHSRLSIMALGGIKTMGRSVNPSLDQELGSLNGSKNFDVSLMLLRFGG
jgi:hypothetical protein